MTIRALVLLVLTGALAGCGGDYNPFVTDTVDRMQPAPDLVEADGRPKVAQVLSVRLERTPGGGVLYATGLPPTQGYWDTELVPLNNEVPVDGVLTYEFRNWYPLQPKPVINQRSREVDVGRFVTDQTLAEVRTIQVVGATNSRSIRP